MPCSRSGSVAIVGKLASAMRCGNSAITARCSALSMPCQRAILGCARPRPKQGLVLGSIMQTAIHGVSLFIQTKDPGAKPRSSPFQSCHDWINILSILGDHRPLELLAQTGAEKMLVDLAQKKGRKFGSVCWLPTPRPFAVQFLPNRSLPGEERERSALFFV
jgi:hypothetical protein